MNLLITIIIHIVWFLNFNFDKNLKITTVCKNWFWARNKLKIYCKSYYENFKFWLANVILDF